MISSLLFFQFSFYFSFLSMGKTYPFLSLFMLSFIAEINFSSFIILDQDFFCLKNQQPVFISTYYFFPFIFNFFLFFQSIAYFMHSKFYQLINRKKNTFLNLFIISSLGVGRFFILLGFFSSLSVYLIGVAFILLCFFRSHLLYKFY
jgi:hypothetical protein